MAGLPRTSKGLKTVVQPKVDDILNRFDRNTITHGYGPHNVPDHNSLRCYDFMVPTIAKGNQVADYIIANRNILGINGIIWNRRVYRMGGTYTGGPTNQWGPYRGSSPHTDHLHVEFNEQPLRAVAPGNSAPQNGVLDMDEKELYGVVRKASMQAIKDLLNDAALMREFSRKVGNELEPRWEQSIRDEISRFDG